MKVLCVIPARYASTRLPGKPLLMLAGKPVIQRVYERALESPPCPAQLGKTLPRTAHQDLTPPGAKPSGPS